MGSQGNKYLDDIYPMYKPEQPLLAEPELPSHMIEVKLRLRRNINEDWFPYLKDRLQRNNMNYVTVDLDNTIIVSGIPPDDHFNQQNVVEIVQEYDSVAQMISSRELRM